MHDINHTYHLTLVSRVCAIWFLYSDSKMMMRRKSYIVFAADAAKCMKESDSIDISGYDWDGCEIDGSNTFSYVDSQQIVIDGPPRKTFVVIYYRNMMVSSRRKKRFRALPRHQWGPVDGPRAVLQTDRRLPAGFLTL